jgi:hypothetical protein
MNCNFPLKKYGEAKILAINRPRRLLLFLNPEANDGYVVDYNISNFLSKNKITYMV